VVLEDLDARSVRWGRATSPLTFAAARATLAALAELHAHAWDHTVLDELRWLRSPVEGPVVEHYRRHRDPLAVARALERPRAAALPAALHDPERIVRAFWSAQVEAARRPRCVLHGDAHLGNVYFEPDGTPGLVDWQAVRQGRWSHDVSLFVVSALDVADRRRWERELLGQYLADLSAHGVAPPTWDDAWLEYRQQVAYGVQGWTCTGSFQPEDVNTANLARFGAAALDLDTFGALGQ
jgi:aminoglycoside phosphotransferase (APT) family kinase protein